MMRRLHLVFVLICLLVFVMPSMAQDDTPQFVPVTCPFMGVRGYTLDCGSLLVPQNRADPDSLVLSLAVVIIRSPNPNPAPDPLVYLVGGPGGSVVGRAPALIESQFAPFLETRDVILMDQRGTGLSFPALMCNEFVQMSMDTLDEVLPAADAITAEINTVHACRDRLAAGGVDFPAYNSAANAADFEALRIALDIPQWNLYGVSYGTRLALTIMRDYPEGVRSVIIDSVYPPQVNLYAEYMPNFVRALDVLFAGCAADAACNAAYPDLEDVFFTVYDALNAEPVSMRYQAGGGVSVLVIDGNRLLDFVFNWLYDVATITEIPRLIYEAAAGDFRDVTRYGLLTVFDRQFIAWGMHYAVQCSDEVSLTTPDMFETLDDDYPRFEAYLATATVFGDAVFRLCEGFSTPADPIENEPVVSSIPTLVMAGEYDPITPPRWAMDAAETLENSYVYVAPGVGHGAIRSNACAQSIGLAFLDAPDTEPDSSCLAEHGAPDFTISTIAN